MKTLAWRVLSSIVAALCVLAIWNGTARPQVNTGNPVVFTQVTQPTNFGVALTTQTIVGSVSRTGGAIVRIIPVQTLAGAGCSVASNTVNITMSFTAPGGTPQTESGGLLSMSMSGNGVIDSNAHTVGGNWANMVVGAGTAITYTVASTLASTGCTVVPQYTVYAQALMGS